MKKKSVSTLLLTLVGAVYLFISVIVGILTEATEEFWMGFGFFTFATAVAVTLILIFANRKTTIRDVFFNAPIYYIGAVYFAVSGALSVLHMLVGLLSFKWMLLIQLAILAVFAVYFIVALIHKTNAENVIQTVADKNAFIRDMSARLNVAAATCGDRETKLQLEKLAEDFQYSKPAAGEELQNVESILAQTVATLENQVYAQDYAAASATAATVRRGLLKRNDIAQRMR